MSMDSLLMTLRMVHRIQQRLREDSSLVLPVTSPYSETGVNSFSRWEVIPVTVTLLGQIAPDIRLQSGHQPLSPLAMHGISHLVSVSMDRLQEVWVAHRIRV